MENDYTVDLSIWCISEKTGDCIGSGMELESTWTNEDIDSDLLIEGMDESYWELCGDFEGSIQTAFEKDEIDDIDRDNLFKVFGHFHFNISIDNKEIEYDMGVNPDEYMYSKLESYIHIKDLSNNEKVVVISSAFSFL